MNLTTDSLHALSQNLGMVLMTAAAAVGIMELSDHIRSRVVVPTQPRFVFAVQSTESSNPLRREREESAPHYISYNTAQRTPGRTGKY